MTTTNDAVDALCRAIGFEKPRMRAVARALTNAGRIPSGSPGKSPELDVWHVVDLVIGCSLDVPLRAVAETVARYRELGEPGHDAKGLPPSVAAQFTSAGRTLDILADMAAYGAPDAQRDVARMQIEVVGNWPEIAIHEPGHVRRFREPGSLATHWKHTGHRRATLIDGSAFVDAIRALFSKE